VRSAADRWLGVLAGSLDALGSVVAGIVTLTLFIIANQVYPPDGVTVNAKNVSSLAMAGSVTGTLTAYAKSLSLTESSGQIDLVLPVPATDCSLLDDQINLPCDAGIAHATQAVTGTWAATRQFEVDNAAGSEVKLATLTPAGDSVSFAVTSPDPLRLCVYEATGETKLTIRIGTTDVSLPTVAGGSSTCSGLVVAFRSASIGPASGFILQGLSAQQGVSAVRVVLTGRRFITSADSVTLTPHSTKTDTTFNTGPIEIDSDREFTFIANGVPAPIGLQNQIVDNAISITDAAVERLPNAYAHYTWISNAGTVAGALVALVLLVVFARRKLAH
jgi:hypothetical protein